MVNAPIGLLDTSILIDALRDYKPAKTWLRNLQDIGVSQAVWLEVIDGAINKQERNRGVKLLLRFHQLDTTPDDIQRAIDALSQFRLSHGVGIMDCPIASTSHRLQIPLYTTNLKHFTPIIGSLAVKPY
jgi:predicted nucleic acid-binding protein